MFFVQPTHVKHYYSFEQIIWNHVQLLKHQETLKQTI